MQRLPIFPPSIQSRMVGAKLHGPSYFWRVTVPYSRVVYLRDNPACRSLSLDHIRSALCACIFIVPQFEDSRGLLSDCRFRHSVGYSWPRAIGRKNHQEVVVRFKASRGPPMDPLPFFAEVADVRITLALLVDLTYAKLLCRRLGRYDRSMGQPRPRHHRCCRDEFVCAPYNR
jgi:hypothetical protein